MIYKGECDFCDQSYIDETARNLESRTQARTRRCLKQKSIRTSESQDQVISIAGAIQWQKRTTLEALLISRFQPTLNKQTETSKLY